MSKIIPYGRHTINQDDINEVVEVLKSDWLTQGPRIAAFEEAFAEVHRCQVCEWQCPMEQQPFISVQLHLEIKPGDKVITTPITFAASANCVRYCGGDVIFADIDPETYLLDIQVMSGNCLNLHQ